MLEMKLKVILDYFGSPIFHALYCFIHLPFCLLSLSQHKCPVLSTSPELWASLCPCPCFFVNASSYTWNALPSQPHSSKASPDDKLFMSPFLMHACSHSSGQEWRNVLSSGVAQHFKCISIISLTRLCQISKISCLHSFYLLPRLVFFEGGPSKNSIFSRFLSLEHI